MRRRAGTNARRAVAEWRLRCGRRAPQPFGKQTRLQNATALSKRRAALKTDVVERALRRPTPQHIEADRAKLWHPYAATPGAPCLPVRSAEGVRLELEDGTQLIDGMSSWWAAVHGYRVPELDRAVADQLSSVAHVMFGGLTHRPAVALGELLVRCTPPGLDRVFLADSGSVAVEVALKMAAQYWRGRGRPEKCRFVALRGGYHGDTLGAMSVSDPATGRHEAFATIPRHHFVARPPSRGADFTKAIESLAEVLARDDVAALILEPLVQGAGGMHFYDPGYLQQARQLCDDHDVLLICDEIATGFGRTGHWFACDEARIAPDILCVGKALTGGYVTMGATLATEKVASHVCAAPPGSQDDALPLMHGPTFMGNPLACAVALASVSKLLKGGWWRRRVRAIEGQLCAGLNPCVGLDTVADVRVKGAIGVVEMKAPLDAAKVAAACPALGVWLRPFGTRLYTMPPFACTARDVARICEAVCFVAANAGDYH
ncbi:unnamed protein product [Pelagomonas calceolata]|uniref:Diaminopelargonic acid synthase n=1 Tax=Pelagomonas calceolata TaxID=35677 RepID=A0A8J2S4B9_9STRA|nr:unnamed protein product [Pelagomonas calceolata]